MSFVTVWLEPRRSFQAISARGSNAQPASQESLDSKLLRRLGTFSAFRLSAFSALAVHHIVIVISHLFSHTAGIILQLLHATRHAKNIKKHPKRFKSSSRDRILLRHIDDLMLRGRAFSFSNSSTLGNAAFSDPGLKFKAPLL